MYSLYHGYGAYGAPEDAITITQVKNGQDALNLMSQVIGILPPAPPKDTSWTTSLLNVFSTSEPEKTEAEKILDSFNLWQAALARGPLTNANIVKMFQQMRAWLQAAKMDAADKKVLNAAKWFYCNIEKPGICDQKTSTAISKEASQVFATTSAFYQQPWFYWTAGAVVVLGIGAVVYSKMQD